MVARADANTAEESTRCTVCRKSSQRLALEVDPLQSLQATPTGGLYGRVRHRRPMRDFDDLYGLLDEYHQYSDSD